MKKKILLKSLLSTPIILPIIATACSIDYGYLSSAANIIIYSTSGGISGREMIYNDGNTNDQPKITYVAQCNKNTIDKFTFDDLDANFSYLTLSTPKYDYSNDTVSVTLSFKTDAITQQWDSSEFYFGGEIEGEKFSCDEKIIINAHKVYNPIPFKYISSLNHGIDGLSKDMGDANGYTYLAINAGWEKINAHAFDPNYLSGETEIDAITSHILPSSVTSISPDKEISADKLGEMSITSIEEAAFMDCQSLQSVQIPQTAPLLKKRCFYGASSINDLKIKYLQRIQPLAFGKNPSLYNSDFPNEFNFISFDDVENTNHTQSGLTWYTQKDKYGKIVGKTLFDAKPSEDASYLYPNENNVCNYTMGSLALGKIYVGGENGLFPNTTEIKSNYLMDNSEVIGAFQDCSSLNEVILDPTIIDMQTSSDGISNAFVGCDGLKNLVINSPTLIPLHPTISNLNGWLNGAASDVKIYVNDDIYSTYMSDTEWSNSSFVNNIKHMSDYPTSSKWWS